VYVSLYTRHFTVSVAEDVVSIRDEGSTNGTRLNNIKLSKNQYAHLSIAVLALCLLTNVMLFCLSGRRRWTMGTRSLLAKLR
jgi:pSer/pThr/pTyr-binding forkhead associated (FHA) protein